MVSKSGRRAVWGALLGALSLLLLAAPAGATAEPPISRATVTAFPQPDVPPTGGDGPLIAGPDGQTWFTGYYTEIYEPGEEPHYLPQIMRIDGQGLVGSVIQHERADGMTLGPDGNVWLTQGRWIARLTAAGQITYFPLPEEQVGQNFTQAAGPIVSGADGNLWFSGYRAIAVPTGSKAVATIDRMTLSGEVTQFELPGPGGFPTRLALGSDGNVWFTEPSEDKVGRITPAGAIQMFSLPPDSRPFEITLGPDGNIWVTMENGELDSLGRITPSGEFTEFTLEAGVHAGVLTSGPDGRLWFSSKPGVIARMTPAGKVSQVLLPNPTSVVDIVAGPAGNLWYTAMPEPPCAPRDAACGDGGNYQSGIVGRIEPAPLSLAIDGGTAAKKGSRAKLRISCHDGAATAVCRGRLRLRAGGKVIAQRRIRLATDVTRGVTLRLDRETREKLARRGHLRVVAKASVAGVGTTTRVVKLKVKAKPQRR